MIFPEPTKITTSTTTLQTTMITANTTATAANITTAAAVAITAVKQNSESTTKPTEKFATFTQYSNVTTHLDSFWWVLSNIWRSIQFIYNSQPSSTAIHLLIFLETEKGGQPQFQGFSVARLHNSFDACGVVDWTSHMHRPSCVIDCITLSFNVHCELGINFFLSFFTMIWILLFVNSFLVGTMKSWGENSGNPRWRTLNYQTFPNIDVVKVERSIEALK